MQCCLVLKKYYEFKTWEMMRFNICLFRCYVRRYSDSFLLYGDGYCTVTIHIYNLAIKKIKILHIVKHWCKYYTVLQKGKKKPIPGINLSLVLDQNSLT